MGYYTRYALEWVSLEDGPNRPSCDHRKPKDAQFCPQCGKPVSTISISDQIVEEIERQKAISSDNFYAIEPDGDTSEQCKWYDHETDMAKFSTKFPDVLFTLHGEGEETRDIWTKYFVNGKVQVEKASVKVGEFNPTLLKPVRNPQI